MNCGFRTETDLQAIREVALAFLDIEPEPVDCIPGYVEHPFFASAFLPGEDGKLVNILDSKEVRDRILAPWKRSLCRADLVKIFAMLQTKYYLTFFGFIEPYLDRKTFSEYLTYVWVASENPNQDANVARPTVVSWFRRADKSILMTEEELAYYKALPDVIDVFRGVSVGRAGVEGLSWTDNLEKAKWFAHRFDRGGKQGYLLHGKIAKKDVLAYYTNRNEDELVCDSYHVFDLSDSRTDSNMY